MAKRTITQEISIYDVLKELFDNWSERILTAEDIIKYLRGVGVIWEGYATKREVEYALQKLLNEKECYLCMSEWGTEDCFSFKIVTSYKPNAHR